MSAGVRITFGCLPLGPAAHLSGSLLGARAEKVLAFQFHRRTGLVRTRYHAFIEGWGMYVDGTFRPGK